LPPAALARLFPSGRQPIWWDDRLFYNYGRTTSDGRILFGGADVLQSARQALAPAPAGATARRLLAGFAPFLPEFADVAPEFCWSGTIAASIDELPLIGEFAPHCHAALGATGLNLAFAAGELVAGSIVGAAAPPELWRRVDLHRAQRWR